MQELHVIDVARQVLIFMFTLEEFVWFSGESYSFHNSDWATFFLK